MAEVSLGTVWREWGRIGCVGFGGPPAHVALLRQLCVDRRGWLDATEFEDAIATCNLLPGPASTQLAIYCAWRVRGRMGALAGGLAFIVPGLILILLLSALFLASAPPAWVRGAGAGAGAAVAAVALHAGWTLIKPSWQRASARDRRASRLRWLVYLAAGGASAATAGPWLVVVLLGCGLAERAVTRAAGPREVTDAGRGVTPPGVAPAWPIATGGVYGSVAWVALKVGLLSFGGGFVIIPLMRADATGHGWMSAAQFLNAVALGQITPGPVVQTVAAVGYAAAGVPGGLLAAAVAFAPSFAFVLGGGRHFGRLRRDRRAQSFLDGAGPAAIGAIIGAAVPLAQALTAGWQFAVLAGAAALLLLPLPSLPLRQRPASQGPIPQRVVVTLLAAGVTGVLIAAAGGPLPH